jgi:hypothetical protein
MDFFSKYLRYVGDSEAPTLSHRWSAISMLSALIGRNLFIPFGHSEIYPNQYIMLMGSPGARKSSAIGIARRLLRDTGFKRFAPDRLSKERFLMEMKPHSADLLGEEDADLSFISFDEPSELYVVAEEFTDFVGQGGAEFMTMLTKLWDNMDRYEHPKIHGKSVVVEKPTVNLLGGNTIQGLSLALPPEALGNGFMSRVIFVYTEETGKKITFPIPPSPAFKQELVDQLKQIKLLCGSVDIEDDARPVYDKLYREFRDVEDHRFKHYSTRRFTHLLKLSLILAASDLRTSITRQDAINANTVLHYTELRMPKALGEFGRSRYSDTTNVILDLLNKSTRPISANSIWKIVAKDLTKIGELTDILRNLQTAGKIQVVTVKGLQGYMPLHQETLSWDSTLLNESYLTEGELL